MGYRISYRKGRQPLIIFRYLAKEVVYTMAAVSGVLLLIIMSGRFIRYLGEAATGQLRADFLFAIMGYRLPGFLELIVPLGLFLGILLAYGRLYVESEMAVLTACGVSQNQILKMTMIPALLIAILVGFMGIVVSPWGANHVENIFAQQDAMTEFETLVPGRFQGQEGAGRVTYTEELFDDRQRMRNVFISHSNPDDIKRRLTVLVAEEGTQQIDDATGARYLVLHNGYRYDGTPGQPDYRVTKYKIYGIKMPESKVTKESPKEKAIATSVLWHSDKPEHQAELQWRLSLPIIVLVVTFLAVPLSKVNPRQGRFLKLLPAVLIYLLYLALLIGLKGAIEDGKVSSFPVLWPAHLIFIGVAWLLLSKDNLPRMIKRKTKPIAQEG